MGADWSLIRARLTSDELTGILKTLKKHYDYSYTGLIEFIDPDGVLKLDSTKIQRHLLGRSKLSPEAIRVIASALHMRLKPEGWDALKGAHPQLINAIYQPSIDLPNALVDWTGTGSNQSDFISKRTGSLREDSSNGQFLNLRISQNELGEPRLLSSLMLVTPPTTKSPMPQFITRRKDSKGRLRSVRGVIFERGNLIYSIGKSRHLPGFRTTMLKGETRASNRHDMFGVRLGMQEDPDQPFAYPLYCYQLKSVRDTGLKRRMQGDKSLEDDLLHRELKGFLPTIIDRLQEAASDHLGCRFP